MVVGVGGEGGRRGGGDGEVRRGGGGGGGGGGEGAERPGSSKSRYINRFFISVFIFQNVIQRAGFPGSQVPRPCFLFVVVV